MASCALTPDSNSSTRVAIGCEKLSNNPGNCSSFSSIKPCSSTRFSALDHCETGFKPMYISMLLTGSGSPPISARPIRLRVYSTSGNSINFCSRIGATDKAVSKLADGANVALKLIVPSSSSGTNSVPICGIKDAAPTSNNNEAIITTLVCFIAALRPLR